MIDGIQFWREAHVIFKNEWIEFKINKPTNCGNGRNPASNENPIHRCFNSRFEYGYEYKMII